MNIKSTLVLVDSFTESILVTLTTVNWLGTMLSKFVMLRVPMAIVAEGLVNAEIVRLV